MQASNTDSSAWLFSTASVLLPEIEAQETPHVTETLMC
jgi:hypothetical protein